MLTSKKIYSCKNAPEIKKEIKKDTISVFIVRYIDKLTPKKHFEIKEVRYFDINNLPESISPGTRKRIDEWLGRRYKSSNW